MAPTAEGIHLRTVLMAMAVVIGSALLFAAGGAVVGYLVAVFFPDNYATVFPRAADLPDFDPVDVGIGLGLTQGGVAGLAVGVVVVLAAAIFHRRQPA